MSIWRSAAVVLTVGLVGAQAPPSPAFDVAVIRQAVLPTADSVRGGQFRVGTNIGVDSADFNFVTIAELIPYAFRVKEFQVVGPSYLNEARWNIQTRFDEGSANQVPEMMQELLTDRFKLTIHREKREQPVYELTVARGGPKMEQVEAGEAATAAPAPALPGLFGRMGGVPEGGFGRGGEGAAAPAPGGRGGRGMTLTGGAGGAVSINMSPESCGLELEFSQLTMASLAETLTPFLDRPVLDSTGLTGSYKAALKLPLEAMLMMMQNQLQSSGLGAMMGGGGAGLLAGRGGAGAGGPGGPGGIGGRGPAAAGLGGCDIASALAGGDTNSSNAIFQAVQGLGLRLQAKKAPFDTIVVDRVERQPTEN